MRHSTTSVGLFALLFFLAAPPAAMMAASQDIRGAARAIDGDTLEVNGVLLNLRGIDAPEPGQTCDRDDKTIPCGDIARWALMDLIAGTEIVCRFDAAISDGDGHTAFCAAGGFDISANMVHTGWAIAIAGDGEAYRSTEARARAAGRGLWAGRFVTPREWRARRAK